jgi:hypothetical protein
VTRKEYRMRRIETIARALCLIGYKRVDDTWPVDTWRAYIDDATSILDALYPPGPKP